MFPCIPKPSIEGLTLDEFKSYANLVQQTLMNEYFPYQTLTKSADSHRQQLEDDLASLCEYYLSQEDLDSAAFHEDARSYHSMVAKSKERMHIIVPNSPVRVESPSAASKTPACRNGESCWYRSKGFCRYSH